MEKHKCTCHCGGAMFYRHMHASYCALAVHGEEAPKSNETKLRERVTELEGLIAWLLGENGEFPDEPPKVGIYRKRFWWRTELRRRFEAINQGGQ